MLPEPALFREGAAESAAIIPKPFRCFQARRMVLSGDPVSITTLAAENLDKSFSGPPLFSGLDLRVEKGLVAVTGRNGSGKTTLLKILAGLMRPTSGRVRIERDPASEEPSAGWRGLSGTDLALYGGAAEENPLSSTGATRASPGEIPPATVRSRVKEESSAAARG